MMFYRCDRCRKEIEDWIDPVPEGRRRPIVRVVVGGPLSGMNATNPDYDLCADCADTLRNWLKLKLETAS